MDFQNLTSLNLDLNITEPELVSECEDDMELEVATGKTIHNDHIQPQIHCQKGFGTCYLHKHDEPIQIIRLVMEGVIVVMAFGYLVKVESKLSKNIEVHLS